MLKERQINIVLSTELYLKSMVEVDIFKDEAELIHVTGHISMNNNVAYMTGRKEFLEEQIEKKKNIVKQITNKLVCKDCKESKILEHIEKCQKLARLAKKDDFQEGYLKALLNVKQNIKEMIDIRDKTGYYEVEK